MINSTLKMILSLLIFWGVINSVFAQSDLEIVDNFKSEFSSIENTIKNATSLVDLKDVSSNISLLKEKLCTTQRTSRQKSLP